MTTVATTELYLSKLALDPRSREARRDSSDGYEMHRTVMSGFPSAHAGGPGGRVLWRLEESAAGISVLVQSVGEPDWRKLPEGWLLRPAESKRWNPRVRTGQRLLFRLRANPTVRRAPVGPKGAKTRRVGIYEEAAQLEWMHRHAIRAGFAVRAATILPEGSREQGVSQRRVGGEKAGEFKRAKYLAVRFDGELVVTDAGRFTIALASGIGPAKAFGFGLLSIARAG